MPKFLLDTNIFYLLRKPEYSKLFTYLKEHKELLLIVHLNIFEILDVRNEKEYKRKKEVISVLLDLVDIKINYYRLSSDQIISLCFSESNSEDVNCYEMIYAARALLESENFGKLTETVFLKEDRKKIELSLKLIGEWKKRLGAFFIDSVNDIIQNTDIKKVKINKDFDVLNGIQKRLNYIYSTERVFIDFIIPTITGMAIRAGLYSTNEVEEIQRGIVNYEKFELILNILNLKKLKFFIEVYLYFIKLCWESKHKVETNDLFDLEFFIHLSYDEELIFVTEEKKWLDYGSDRIIGIDRLSEILLDKK